MITVNGMAYFKKALAYMTSLLPRACSKENVPPSEAKTTIPIKGIIWKTQADSSVRLMFSSKTHELQKRCFEVKLHPCCLMVDGGFIPPESSQMSACLSLSPWLGLTGYFAQAEDEPPVQCMVDKPDSDVPLANFWATYFFLLPQHVKESHDCCKRQVCKPWRKNQGPELSASWVPLQTRDPPTTLP